MIFHDGQMLTGGRKEGSETRPWRGRESEKLCGDRRAAPCGLWSVRFDVRRLEGEGGDDRMQDAGSKGCDGEMKDEGEFEGDEKMQR